ncbi:MAG: PAS domain S-box protein [Bacteroidota bacterium]
MEKNYSSPKVTLRQQAEKILKQRKIKLTLPTSNSETLQLMRELQLQKIELELQQQEFRQLQETTQLSDNRKKIFINASPNGVFMKDEQGRYIVTNTTLDKIFQKTKTQILGKTDRQLMPLAFAQNCEKTDGEAIKNKTVVITEEKWNTTIYKTVKFPVEYEKGKIGVGGYVYDITEKTLADETSNLYSYAFNGASEAIIITDLNYTIINLNPAAETIYGWARQEAIGKPLTSLIQHEYIDESRHSVVKTFNATGSWQGEVMQTNRHGARLHILASISSIQNKAGQAIGIYAVNTDITELKKTQILLQEREYFFRESQHAAFIGSFKINFDSEQWQASDVFDLMFGIDETYQHNMRGWLNLVHPIDRKMIDTYLKTEVIAKKQPFQKEFRIIRRSDNQLRWVMGIGKVEFGSNDKVISLIGTIQDITRRMQTEENLKQSNELFNLFLQHSPIYTYIKEVTPTESRVVLASQNIAQMLGMNAEHMVSKNMYQLFPKAFAKQMTTDDWQVVSQGKILTLDENLNQRHYTSIKFPLKLGNKNLLAGYTMDITEQRHAEEQLKETESKFRNIFESANVGKSITQLTGEISVNKAFCNMLGYKPTELEHKTWQEITPTEDIEPTQLRMSSLLSGETRTIRFEKRYIHKNGSLVWADVSSAMSYDKNAQPSYLITTIVDINQRKLAEQTAAENLKKFEAIFNNNSAAIATIEPDTTIVMVNDAYCKMSGYSRKDVIGSSWIKQIPPHDLDRLMEYSRQRNNNPQDAPDKYEFTFYKKDGEIRNSLMTISMIEGTKTVIASFVDITERKQAEQAATESLKKFEAIFKNNPAAIAISTLDTGQLADVNNAWESITEHSRADVIGKQIIDLNIWVDPEQRVQLSNTVRRHGKGHLEIQLRRKSGEILDLLMTAEIIELLGKSYLITMGQDITDSKRAEDALKESEEKYSIAFKTSPYAIIITNPANGRIVNANDSFYTFSGYTHKETESNTTLEMNLWANPADRAQVVKKLQKGEKVVSQEYTFRKKNGEIMIALYSAQHIVLNNETYILSSINDITERKLAESFLQDIIDKNPLSIQIIDDKGYTLQTNAAHTKLFGAVPPPNWSLFTDPQLIKQGFVDLFIRSMAGEQVAFPDSYFNIHDVDPSYPDNPIWMRIEAFPLAYNTGKQKRFVIMHEDITARKQAEAELRQSEEIFRALNTESKVMIELPDVKSTYNYIVSSLQKRLPDTFILFNSIDETKNNLVVESIGGLSNKLMQNIIKIAGFNPIGKHFKLHEENNRYYKLGKLVEFDGGLFEFSANQFPKIAAKAIEKIIGLHKIYTIGISKEDELLAAIHFFTFNKKVITDNRFIEIFTHQAGKIIAKKLAEEALSNSRNFLQSIVENIPNSVFLKDANTLRYLHMNYAGQNLVGLTADKIIGKTDLEIYPKEVAESFIKTDQTALKHKKMFVVPELTLPTKFNGQRLMRTKKVPILNAQGKPEFLLGIADDITEHKLIETYNEMGRSILEILNQPGDLEQTMQHIIAAMKKVTGFDAVGIRLQNGDDYPYHAQIGFPDNFIAPENSLKGTDKDGLVCLDANGKPRLECTCGLVISGNTPANHPLFTSGGSFWVNDSPTLLNMPPASDPRFQPRNLCIYQGYTSFVMVPIKNTEGIVGLIQCNDRRKDCFTHNIVQILEGIASHIGTALMRKQAEAALQTKMDELLQFNRLTVGREIAMIDLKIEINALLKQLGQKPKYKIVE